MMQAPELNDCFLHDKDRLTHDAAVELLVTRVPTLRRIEDVLLAEAHGRVVGKDVTAAAPIPGHRNAAVDGYALRFADYETAGAAPLLVSARVAAGHPLQKPHAPGTVVRIFTGAPVPHACDTVVMQEDVTRADVDGQAQIKLPTGVKRGSNIRDAGEDVAMSDTIASAGTRLRPQECAALASAGVETVACFARPRVAYFSSGDEVVRPGRPLAHGQVYDANVAMLPDLIRIAGGIPVDCGILPDSRDAVRAALREAATSHDLVLTSGGASLGEEDHIVSVLDEIGRRHLWQIAVKPGRPMMFGQVENALFMGLPGNPVAVFVCFLLYGQPLLARLGGATWRPPTRFPVAAGFEIARKKVDRREYLRGWLEAGPDGLIAQKFPRDGSGLISSLRAASGFIELPEHVSQVRPGSSVNFIPLAEFGVR
ncbi:MAG: gephyrin-like molybdotransferase Glp [Pseudomonadota bacterium]